MKKQYLTAGALLDDSVSLALNVINSGYVPDLLVGIWRGGSPIAITIHEVFCACGHPVDHTVIRARSYTGIDQQTAVSVKGVESLFREFPEARKILLVDDVFDTGNTIKAIVDRFSQQASRQNTEIRIAVPWYKPSRSQVELIPDYALHETENWLVFPHEICGLNSGEIKSNKPEISDTTHLSLLQLLRQQPSG